MAASRRSRSDNTVTWVKANATNVLEKREILPDIPMPEDEIPTVNTDVYKADYDGNPDNWIVPPDAIYVGIKKFDIKIIGLEDGKLGPMSFKKALADFKASQVKVMEYYDTGIAYFHSTVIFDKNDDFRGKNIKTPVQKFGKYTSVVLMKTGPDLLFQTSQEILNISKLPVNIDVYSGGKTLYDGVNIGGGGPDFGFSKTEIAISDITDAANQCAANSFNAGSQGFTLRKKENAEGIWECWPKKYTADTLKSTNFEYLSPSQRTYIFDSAKDNAGTDDIVNYGSIGETVPSMKTWWNSSRPVNIENGDKFFIRKDDLTKYLDINTSNKLWVWSDTPSYSFQVVSGGMFKVFDGTGKTEDTNKMFGTRTPASGPRQGLVMTYEGGTVVTNLTFTPVAGQVNKYKIFMNPGNTILYYHDDVDTPWINAYPGFTNPSDSKTEFILEPVMPS